MQAGAQPAGPLEQEPRISQRVPEGIAGTATAQSEGVRREQTAEEGGSSEEEQEEDDELEAPSIASDASDDDAQVNVSHLHPGPASCEQPCPVGTDIP